MDQKVDRIPDLGQLGKGGIQRAGIGDVAIDQGGRLHRLDQRDHPLLEQVALVGEGQFRARLMQGLGDAPGNGMLVGDPHDEPALALHQAVKRHFLFSDNAAILVISWRFATEMSGFSGAWRGGRSH
jgi:hypothetical protein